MQKEQTVKSRKLSWSKGLLALLSLAVLAAGQLLSQSVGTLLSFAQFPVDLCNLAVGVVYVLSVLYGVSWVCKALGLSLADCRILPVHFSLLWTVIALAMPGIVCLILLNLPGSWEVALFSHEQLAALLSAAVCVIGLGTGIVEEAIFRGVFLTVLERLVGRWAAVLLPSVLFAALHLIGRPMDLPSFFAADDSRKSGGHPVFTGDTGKQQHLVGGFDARGMESCDGRRSAAHRHGRRQRCMGAVSVGQRFTVADRR